MGISMISSINATDFASFKKKANADLGLDDDYPTTLIKVPSSYNLTLPTLHLPLLTVLVISKWFWNLIHIVQIDLVDGFPLTARLDSDKCGPSEAVY